MDSDDEQAASFERPVKRQKRFTFQRFQQRVEQVHSRAVQRSPSSGPDFTACPSQSRLTEDRNLSDISRKQSITCCACLCTGERKCIWAAGQTQG